MRNITLSLPEDLLQRLKVIAAKRQTSVSSILTQTLGEIADEEDGYAAARRGMLSDLRKGYDLGTKGRVSWDRASLHERQTVR